MESRRAPQKWRLASGDSCLLTQLISIQVKWLIMTSWLRAELCWDGLDNRNTSQWLLSRLLCLCNTAAHCPLLMSVLADCFTSHHPCLWCWRLLEYFHVFTRPAVWQIWISLDSPKTTSNQIHSFCKMIELLEFHFGLVLLFQQDFWLIWGFSDETWVVGVVL